MNKYTLTRKYMCVDRKAICSACKTLSMYSRSEMSGVGYGSLLRWHTVGCYPEQHTVKAIVDIGLTLWCGNIYYLLKNKKLTNFGKCCLPAWFLFNSLFSVLHLTFCKSWNFCQYLLVSKWSYSPWEISLEKELKWNNMWKATFWWTWNIWACAKH